MLKLKKLQILGFKSFCDRTELKFPGEGVAAVVGPNGCGKSNIADSISWVLGEQSAKSLRGVRMEDVIFAGTRDRKPTGMAEVSLTLIDPQVYEGQVSGVPEIDIQDDMPLGMNDDDWDEASVRASAAEATEAHVAEVQPGPLDWKEGVDAAAEGEAPESGSDGAAEVAKDGTPAEAQAEVVGQQPSSEESQAASAEPSSTSSEPNAEAAQNAANPVVLKIRRRKFKPMVFAKGEIMVTRRLFRTGESEYLLNGKLCRLRDIQDIFMGTGLGPESYAIIEQGRIGQILSSKPHDRRAIIEEAAGITKFKTRKRLAEARLEQARLNLARINDIFDEVTRQMNSLKRQASKAERYARLRDEMKEKLRVVLASKFAQMGRDEAGLNASLEAMGEEIRTRSEAVTAKEAEHTERTQRGYAIESEIAHNSQIMNALAVETERAISRRGANEERCAELDARSAAAQAELERAQAQSLSLADEVQTSRRFVESAASEVATAQYEWQALQQASQDVATSLTDLERQQEARRQNVMEAMASASQVRNQIIQAEEHITALEREAQRLERESAAAQVDIEAFGGKRGQIAFEFESITQTAAALGARISDIRSQMESKRKEEEERKRNLDTLRAEYATAQGKKSSLESVINEHGYSTESVKRLFQSGAMGNGFTPAGVLADFLEVETRYESVVEEFLRDELNYVVVKSWDSANEGMRLLQSDVDGRATFLVHPEDSQARFSFVASDAPPPTSPRHEEIVSLKNCIRVLDGFGRSLEVVLPKLRDGYITQDSNIARNLALENPDAYFLSSTGECFHNVTVTGGKQRKEGPLSLKRELRELAKLAGDLETAIQSEQASVQTLARELNELSKLLGNLEEERREAEKQALTQGHALKQMETELARTEQRLNTYRLEYERTRSERDEKSQIVAEKREQAEALEQKRQALEDEMKVAQQRLVSLRATRDGAAQSASEAAARLAVVEERRRTAASALERIESLSSEAKQRVDSLQTQIQSAAAEKVQREAENLQIAERLQALAAEKTAAEATGVQLQHESEQVRARIAEIDQELKAARAELDATRDRKSELGTQLAKLQSDLAHMAESCMNELGISADELRANAEIPLVEGEQLALEETTYREMRTKLDNMGPVNMMALEEFKETEQRHQFLETQRKDLLESIENTQATIKEIDEFSRQKFQEAFERINENFQFTFRKLFGGGQAFMRLTDEINTAESGIDVVASPPGKKLQNVLLLSGGEKALTALSLLVGIFQYQPSPFCILDEVDAPLDEANIGRFTELVKEMAVGTQFIIITHSKKTMSIAPVMYGVTMQEPGVSKIVSVKFGAETAGPRAVSA
ncbi:MAG TPA: chromosome segregation protein SMC [Candidatus Angelobacter sp.]|nr:chromosome segregation protein SMC [Candidatus Angelobacter sp.]